MKRFALLLVGLLMLGAIVPLQAKPKAKPATLQFHANGEFKILHFTDLHYIYGREESPVAIDCLHKVIEAEQPDLIVITKSSLCPVGWGDCSRQRWAESQNSQGIIQPSQKINRFFEKTRQFPLFAIDF